MKEFKNKVAVVTGAASGMGRSIASHCAQEGMKIVLSDINDSALQQAEQELKSEGATVIAAVTDVSCLTDMEVLSEKTMRTFGRVDLLFNNAGVTAATSIWASNLSELEWIIRVDLWGVIYGIRVFLPVMIEQNSECHIINTASATGLTSMGTGIYRVAKHGIVALSESLYHELREMNVRVKVSVLCPMDVKTNIFDTSVQNRPQKLQDNNTMVDLRAGYLGKLRNRTQSARYGVEQGMLPQEVADIIFDAIRHEQFYIITHPELKPLIQMRMEDILIGRNPTVPTQ